MNGQLTTIKNYIIALLFVDFGPIEVTEKLQEWPSLSFSDFSQELLKQGVDVYSSRNRDWETLFSKEKNKYNRLKLKTDYTSQLLDFKYLFSLFMSRKNNYNSYY
jgi:hypothetical protein